LQDELEVLRDVISRLDQAGLAYMLTGSLALDFYAQPRMTRDIDIVVALEPRHTDLFLKSFATGYTLYPETVKSAIARRSAFNIIHEGAVMKVDIIVLKDTEYGRCEFERRQRLKAGKLEIWVVTREDLIISKLLWAKESRSELQMRDVRNLLAGGCDKGYITRWVRVLGLGDLWRGLTHE